MLPKQEFKIKVPGMSKNIYFIRERFAGDGKMKIHLREMYYDKDGVLAHGKGIAVNEEEWPALLAFLKAQEV